MNIQTDPSLLKGIIEPLPASADQPIRSTFFHEANMRKFGEELAQSTPAVPGFSVFDFQRRIRENGNKILEVYRATNDAQAKGEIDHASRAMAARQPLPGRRDDLPGQARPAAPLLQASCRSHRVGGSQPLPRALAHCLGLCRAFRQLGFGHDVRGDRRRLPVGRAAEDRRIVGAAVAAALRADREPAPAGAARQPRARDAQRRQRRGRPRLRRGRRRGPGRDPRALRRARARHHLRHAAALPAARRLAECRASAGLARERAREVTAPTPRRSSSASTRRCPPATSPPATSSAACG